MKQPRSHSYLKIELRRYLRTVTKFIVFSSAFSCLNYPAQPIALCPEGHSSQDKARGYSKSGLQQGLKTIMPLMSPLSASFTMFRLYCSFFTSSNLPQDLCTYSSIECYLSSFSIVSFFILQVSAPVCFFENLSLITSSNKFQFFLFIFFFIIFVTLDSCYLLSDSPPAAQGPLLLCSPQCNQRQQCL